MSSRTLLWEMLTNNVLAGVCVTQAVRLEVRDYNLRRGLCPGNAPGLMVGALVRVAFAGQHAEQ